MAKRSSSINIDLGTLKEDIRKYANNVCRYAASEIADELTESARLAIESFYDDYSPHKYKRHYANFRKNAYRRLYANPHNTVYYGGVELTPGQMKDVYQHPVDEVYGSVMEIGSHGPELYTIVEPMDIPPIQQIYNKQDEILHNREHYINRAKTKAQHDNYSMLSFAK